MGRVQSSNKHDKYDKHLQYNFKRESRKTEILFIGYEDCYEPAKGVRRQTKVITLLKHKHMHSPWQVLLNHFSHLMLQIQDGSLTTFSKRTVAMQLSPCSAALQVEDGVSP